MVWKETYGHELLHLLPLHALLQLLLLGLREAGNKQLVNRYHQKLMYAWDAYVSMAG